MLPICILETKCCTLDLNLNSEKILSFLLHKYYTFCIVLVGNNTLGFYDVKKMSRPTCHYYSVVMISSVINGYGPQLNRRMRVPMVLAIFRAVMHTTDIVLVLRQQPREHRTAILGTTWTFKKSLCLQLN